MFDPITTPAQLPPIGAHETETLDFKSTYKPSETFEMAKDVAALANAVGGTLLVGAAEDAAEKLSGYVPVAPTEAADLQTRLEVAVTQRCSPAPFISATRIEHPARPAHEVVAVNVWAFPAQAVGVKIGGSMADGYGGDAWVFPIRVGTQTKYLEPEMLAMLMLPEIRRKAILLHNLGVDRSITLRATGGVIPGGVFHFQRVDLLRNVLVLKAFNQKIEEKDPTAISKSEIWIPLDDVTKVSEMIDGAEISIIGRVDKGEAFGRDDPGDRFRIFFRHM